MSLARAEDKLKEFFRYVSPNTAKWLSRAYEALKKFHESSVPRIDLTVYIRFAIEDSLTQAVREGVIDCETAMFLFGEIMQKFGMYFDLITIKADINAFIELLNDVITCLSAEKRYAEWVSKLWEGATEIIRMIFKI